MNVSYGSYTFPSPTPSIVFGEEPIYVAGEMDAVKQKIQLIGLLTGLNLNSLSTSKKQMEEAFLTSFGTLNIGSESFTLCKPLGVSFSDSDLTTILPYSVEFERFQEKTFSNYYGVLSPADSWSYTEQDGRVVSATHSVSAVGFKIDGTDPLVNARDFVNSRLNGFENLSIVNPNETTAILREKTEEADRFLNSYAVTENYTFSTSRDDLTTGRLISANTQINYSKNSDSSITVNGSILGQMNGTPVATGMFTPQNAADLAKKALQSSKSSYEDQLYEFVEKEPTSYNYDINERDNSISFSFNFSDALNGQDEVVHYYTVKISANKDAALVSVSVDGEITYKGFSNIFVTGELPAESERYIKIQEKFDTINPYNLAVEEYNNFYSVVNSYDGNAYLNPNPESESITKSPYIPSISYSYSYNNKLNLDDLKGLSIDYTDNKPMIRNDYIETIGGFGTTYTSVLGRNTVSASSTEDNASINTLKNIVNSYLKPISVVNEESQSEGTSSISYTKGGYYR